jgi:hypothetical protein
MILRHREFDHSAPDFGGGTYHMEAGRWNACTEDDKPTDCIGMPDKLAQLGNQGWELVAVMPRSSAIMSNYAGATTEDEWLFKRPKQ